MATLTFHGGMTSLNYPWGNFAHQKDPYTAEDSLFKKISVILRDSAGSNEKLGV